MGLTKPIKDLLPDLDNKGLQDILNGFSYVLKEVINFSTHIFKWGKQLKDKDGDELLPIFLSYRHILELLDAISLLIEKGSTEPCKLLLRGILESTFNILYILKNDTEVRSKCFIVWYQKRKLKYLDSFNPETNAGKDFFEQLKVDFFAGNNPELFIINNTGEQKTLITKQFQKEKYKNISDEYEAKKKHNWYSLYNGPRNLQELAKVLNLYSLYHILYKQWSEAIHGTDIFSGKMSRDENGLAAITQLRYFEHAQTVTSISIALYLKVSRSLSEKSIKA